MTDKKFCLNSYIAYRYIYKEGIDFYPGLIHKNFVPIPVEKRIPVSSSQEIDLQIKQQFEKLYQQYDNIGILLSGGMDSANLASYLKPGSHAYTFVADDTKVFNHDVERSDVYCKKWNLKHHYVKIDKQCYDTYTPTVMEGKCAPVHSIEPQIYKAALEAKNDGVQLMIVGESADLIFGGMDQLIGKDWGYDEFVKRYTFLPPELVLSDYDPRVYDLYEKYRIDGGKIDFLTFMDEVFSIESSGSYWNAFGVAHLPYYDPYACLIMKDKLNLERVRNGEPKYLVRGLYSIKYPELPVPDKIPMPRPVDEVFKNWKGPKRSEFRNDIPMDKLTGNQKWQLWCAEKFLDIHEPETK
ncbi:MAG: asparagine synthase-related protein [Sodaliphilus pleomorphus]|jgi:hypothetical protein|uniref:asparagine synthase-related protein n=1 Tax=Sodaliphilus pleomorphus TaxID=2606626 RepID=UPI0023F0DDD4|nr:asparagine synthase-related protein [Sodaliphilus pleomorphus]MCI5979521.1 asparagine synthase-related protein [Muribaculaceae bacterium]MDY6253144.1 asparagine synthase-related protein [Bacteroidales bacterium]MCI6168785.1 asparagine synthase-related protein [Muribaculaceae bacterium]MDD7066070.1 asparagine synthase-related protein [Sodaliphilus pleomorphus]MDY2833370.1 asparagine synthase-related protein [Sodaliphilus pleomorphus]